MTEWGRRWGFSGLGCALVFCLAGPAEAGPIARILGSLDERFPGQDINIDEFDRTVIGSTSDALHSGFGISNERAIDLNAFSAAGNGGVHASTNTSYDEQVPESLGGFLSFRATGVAELTMDDMMIGGAPGTFITTPMHLHLTGALEAGSALYSNSIFTNGSTQVTGGSNVSVEIRVNGNKVGEGFQELASINGAFPTVTGSGLLAHFDGDDVLTTSPFTVATNTFFSVMLSLGVISGSEVLDGGAGRGTSIADFSNTLTFVQNGPVFDLPAGYTANSLEAGIVNNRFTPADGANVVPEPSSIILWGIGALCLAIGSLRSRRRARAM